MRRLGKKYPKSLVIFLCMTFVVLVGGAALGGVISRMFGGGWHWSWCLVGAEAVFAMFYFGVVPALLATGDLIAEDLQEDLDRQLQRSVAAERKIDMWNELKHRAPRFQAAVDFLLMAQAVVVRNRDDAAKFLAKHESGAVDITAVARYAQLLEESIDATRRARQRFEDESERMRELGFTTVTLEAYLAKVDEPTVEFVEVEPELEPERPSKEPLPDPQY